MDGPYTRALAEFISGSRFTELPDAVVERAMDGTSYSDGNPVEIEMPGGTALSAWGKVRGDVDNPVRRVDVVEKFTKLTSGRLSQEKQAAVTGLCERLDTIDDISALIDPLNA